MKRFISFAILASIVAGTACSALAESITIHTKNERYDLRLILEEKLPANGERGVQKGYFVFVSSARLENDVLDVAAIERVAECTSVRPRFGLTQPSNDGFRYSAYAVYYGPYYTRDQALNVRSAVTGCIADAYVNLHAGNIQRF